MKVISKRRRLEGKTNYVKRRRLLEGAKTRIVIRKTNRYIIIQYVGSKGAQDNILVSKFSRELLNYGWPEEKVGSLKSLGAGYLIGLLFGKIMNEKYKEAKPAIDTGLIRNTKGSKIYAVLNGVVDSGFNIAHNKKVFPEEKRIKNKNVIDFFDKVKENILKKGGKK